jgi:hypothetical protein
VALRREDGIGQRLFEGANPCRTPIKQITTALSVIKC